MRSIGVVLPLYIWYFLRQKSFLRDAEQRMTGAVGQRRVPVNFLKETNLAIPPLSEQRRIVDKLDRIGDRQRSARNELSHIPKLSARYKQAVLAAACSGKLTEDFRLSNSLSISSISLSEVCNSISDGDHQAPPRSETGIPFITISAINDGSLSLNKATRFVP
ncbi:MAG: restriction endonuclease subunit S, partial [Pseudanabaena sp.]